jgi:hypothetical protein
MGPLLVIVDHPPPRRLTDVLEGLDAGGADEVCHVVFSFAAPVGGAIGERKGCATDGWGRFS